MVFLPRTFRQAECGRTTEITVPAAEVGRSLLAVCKRPANHNLLSNPTMAENTLVNLGFNAFWLNIH
jgi:hypothetical protein